MMRPFVMLKSKSCVMNRNPEKTVFQFQADERLTQVGGRLRARRKLSVGGHGVHLIVRTAVFTMMPRCGGASAVITRGTARKTLCSAVPTRAIAVCIRSPTPAAKSCHQAR